MILGLDNCKVYSLLNDTNDNPICKVRVFIVSIQPTHRPAGFLVNSRGLRDVLLAIGEHVCVLYQSI